MVVLSYEQCSANEQGLAMPIRGLRARANPDGSVVYGGQGDILFQYDGTQMPTTFSGSAINIAHDSELVGLLLRLDKACKRQLARRRFLPDVPRLQKIWLGFAPDEVPSFEHSPALWRKAAEQLDVPIERLGENGDVLLDRLLRDVWQESMLQPGDSRNPTGKHLVDAELCTQA
jgi:hypothetical protein